MASLPVSLPETPHSCITGASSGLGAALAIGYAQHGHHLTLLGRDCDRLQQVQAQCMEAGAPSAAILCVDVTDAAAMHQALTEADSKRPITHLIANAGISGGTSGMAGESAAQAEAIFSTNVMGVVHSIQPVLPAMRQRQHGHVAIISSLAGFRGLPSAPAYSASKMAVRGYGEALRGLLAEDGIQVSVVCPGYIRTPLTEKNTFPMPGLMDADQAARRIIKGLTANRSRIVFPRWFGAICWLLGALPPCMTDGLYARLPRK